VLSSTCNMVAAGRCWCLSVMNGRNTFFPLIWYADQRTIPGGTIARARRPPVHLLRCANDGAPRRTEPRRTGLPRRTDLRRTGLSHTDLCRNRMRTRAPCGQPSKIQQDSEGQPPGSPPPRPGLQARLTLWVSMRALAYARFHSSAGEQPRSPGTSPRKATTCFCRMR